MNLRDHITLDGRHPGRIVGVSIRDYNVELADGSIEANVKPSRISTVRLLKEKRA